MNNFVISVKTAADRRDHIHTMLSLAQIDYTFFDAVEHNDIAQALVEFELQHKPSELKNNELSCLLSHLYLWKKISNSSHDYIAIFEDDIHLGEHAPLFLSNTAWIPKGIEIIKLEYFYSHIAMNNHDSIKVADGRELRVLTDKHLGCGGYILSKHAATVLLNFVRDYHKILPVDHYIFNFFLLTKQIEIYQMYPALCIQDHKLKTNSKNFSSHLANERQMRKGEGQYKIKLGFTQKISKEVCRIGQQMRHLLSSQKKSDKTKLYFR